MERKIIFHIIFSDEKCIIELKEYDTVGCLKDVIFKETGIPKSKQELTGWRQSPDDDHDILQKCADNDIANILHLQENNILSFKNIPVNDYLELKACTNFMYEVINNISDISLLFHNGLLENKIHELFMAPLGKRKVLLLYLHNKLDPFSKIFWRNMKKSYVKEILTKRFCVIGWDLSDKTLHNALIGALNYNELDHIVPYINNNMGAAICLITDDDQKGLKIFSCMTKTISDTDFFNCLLNASESGYEKQVINSVFVQQNFADSLGGRDYDSYEFDEHFYLKKNIGFAIAGPPTEETGYNDRIKNEIEKLYSKIRSKNNEVARYRDKVEIAIIYNCTEPLPNVKNDKKKKIPGYDPDEDIMPFPVFIIRKCHGSKNPCRIFIDHMGRVYSTWKEYLTENKLPECKMVNPKNGKYEFDENGKVILQWNDSPACNTANKILKGLDIAGAVGGVASGGVGLASTMLAGTAVAASSPLLAAALPVAGIAAGVTAPVVGAYSMARSSMTIDDRRRREEGKSLMMMNLVGEICNNLHKYHYLCENHSNPEYLVLCVVRNPLFYNAVPKISVKPAKELIRTNEPTTSEDDEDSDETGSSLNFFKSSEARGAYMNIVAGSLGFIGAGTNVIFSNIVSNGQTIGTGAKVAVNAINAINLGAGGASMVNSVHDVISQWVINKESPSALMLLQLSSNILFFGHAVVNFKTATTIIDEAQAKVLQDYSDNLRSNRHRKIFNRILKETLRKNDGNSVQSKTEVIAALRNIKNKDETFAALTRNLSKLNKKGIKVFVENGQIKFNDVAIDMVDFCTIKSNEVNSFLTSLPVVNNVNAAEVTSVQNVFSVNNIIVPNTLGLVIYAAKLIRCYNGDVKEMIISTVAKLLDRITEPVMKLLKDILPNDSYREVFNTVLNFFSKKAQEYEEKYQKWKTTNSDEDYSPIFDYVDSDKTKRCIKFMEEAVRTCFEFKHMKKEVFKRLIKYCYERIASKYNDHQENKERKKQRKNYSAQMRFTSVKTDCKVCGGHYFKSQR